jgi:hypothetical protein
MSETPLDRHCGTCVFYREVESEQGSGTCRRYPPQVFVRPLFDPVSDLQSGSEVQYLQPWVDDDDTCGEYKRS